MINDEYLKQTNKLILYIQESSGTNTMVLASEITSYIIKSLRDEYISLYEAYVLNGEVISLMKGSRKDKWRIKVRIRTCLLILNQRMLAILYGDMEYAEKLKEIGCEAMKLNAEKREHFIMDNYESYLDAHTNEELLKKLEYTREFYDKLLDEDYDRGPFTNESFPYDDCAIEKIFLSDNPHLEKTEISKEVEDIIVEIAINM